MPGLPPGERPRMVNSRTFELAYDVDAVGPSGIGRVELWGTRDGGQSWRRFTTGSGNRNSLMVTVDDEGLYGFRVGGDQRRGLGGKPPRSGDLPDIWIGVDLTKPTARIVSAEPGVDAEAGRLIISWQADDLMLAARPVSLLFSQDRGGPWTPIASGMENTGRYAWLLDTHTPPQGLSAAGSARRGGQRGRPRIDRAGHHRPIPPHGPHPRRSPGRPRHRSSRVAAVTYPAHAVCLLQLPTCRTSFPTRPFSGAAPLFLGFQTPGQLGYTVAVILPNRSTKGQFHEPHHLLMLTLGLSLAPVLCWAAEPKADQAKAIAEIEKLGGKVTVDEKSPGKPVISVEFEWLSRDPSN